MTIKHVSIIAVALLLAACSKPAHEIQAGLPHGLKDCTYFEVDRGGGNRLHVIRCPASTTSTQWNHGKNNSQSTTADVVEDAATLQQKAREIALSKLTPAEREVLGIK